MTTKEPRPCSIHGREHWDWDISHRTVANYGAINIDSSSASLTKSTSYSSSNQSLSSFASIGNDGRVGHDDNNIRRADGRPETESLLDHTALEFQETIEQYEHMLWRKTRGGKIRQLGKSALIGGVVFIAAGLASLF